MAAKKKSAGPSWTTLSTASGKASKVPALLKAMQTPGPEAEGAMRKLASLLAAGGRAFDAAPAVVQTIAEQIPSWPGDRVHVIALMRYLVSLGEPGMRDHTGLALSRPELSEKYHEPTAKALLGAVTELSPLWRDLLGDKDPLVRAATAHLLGLLPGAANDNVGALTSQLSKENDRGVRVSIVVALGQLARSEARVKPVNTKELAAIANDGDPLVGGMAVVMRAVVESSLAEMPDTALADMFAELALYRDIPYMQQRANESERPDWAFRWFSWNGGSLDVLAVGLLTEIGDDEARRVLTRAFGSALQRDVSIGRISPARKEWPERAMKWFFEERKEPFTSASQLTDLQKEILRELSRRENAGSYEAYGLPSDARSRQRLLGIRAPSILERPGPTGTPLWIALRKVQQEFTFATTSDDFETFVRARLPLDLSAREWLDLWAECETGAYLLRNYLEFPPLKNVGRYSGAAVAEWARAWLKEIESDKSLREISNYVILTYLRTLPPDHELSAEFDDAFMFGSGSDAMAREVFTHFPAARREAIARRALEDPHDESVTRLLAYPELAPAAAASLDRLKPPNANFFAPRPVSANTAFCDHVRPYKQLQRLYQTQPIGP